MVAQMGNSESQLFRCTQHEVEQDVQMSSGMVAMMVSTGDGVYAMDAAMDRFGKPLAVKEWNRNGGIHLCSQIVVLILQLGCPPKGAARSRAQLEAVVP